MFSTFEYRQYSISLYENKLADGSRSMACFRCACCIVRSLGGNLNVNKPRTVIRLFYFQMKHFYLIFVGLALASCSNKLVTTSVGYQSVRTLHSQPTSSASIPDEAKIVVAYSIGSGGDLTAIVYNRTSEIMTIDQTKSFFVNSNGKSISYFDPTVKTTSVSNISSTTKGGSINLGALTGAFGIGGVLGQIADGVNLGGSGTNGTQETTATYVADLPQVSIAPHSSGAMSKTFWVEGLGSGALHGTAIKSASLSSDQSYCRFSVCISYSTDGGQTFDKLVTEFYANSKIIIPVEKHGMVNDALRQIYQLKPDAINEHLWLLNFNSSLINGYNNEVKGLLYDYK